MRSARRSSSPRAAGSPFWAGSRLIAAAEARARDLGSASASRPPVPRSGSSGWRVSAVFTVVFVRRPELVPLVDPHRRTVPPSARLRRRPPVLRRPGRERRRSGGCSRSTASSPPPRSPSPGASSASAARRFRRCRGRSRFRSRRFVSFAALSVLWSDADAPAQNLLQYFLLPFVVLVAVVARAPFPAWMPRALGIAAVALAALFAAVGLVEEATHRLSSTPPPSRSGTRTRASSASPRSSATRACTAATSCSGSAIVLVGGVVPQARDRARGADRRVPLRRPLLLLLAVEPRGALRGRRVRLASSPATAAVRLVAAITAVLVLAGGGAFVADKVAGASTQRVTSDRSRRIDLTRDASSPSTRSSASGSAPSRARARRCRRTAARRRCSSRTRRRSPSPPSSASSGSCSMPRFSLGAAKALLRVLRLERGIRARARRGLPRALRPLALLQRLLRGSAHLARARRRVELPRRDGRRRARTRRVSGGVDRRAAFGVLGVLGLLVAINVPSLGSDPWPFRTPAASAHGLLGPLVRAADGQWDLGVVRTPAVVAGRARRGDRDRGLAARSRGGRGSSSRPASPWSSSSPSRRRCSRSGLRDGYRRRGSTRTTRPTRSSSPASSCAHGHTPYGHDYDGSGLERFYSRDGSPPPPYRTTAGGADALRLLPGHRARRGGVELRPGPVRRLPRARPARDDRLLLRASCSSTLRCRGASPSERRSRRARCSCAAPGSGRPTRPGSWRCSSPSRSLTRSRYVWAAVALAAAILLKQFALVAVPFFVVMLLAAGLPARRSSGQAAAFAGVLARRASSVPDRGRGRALARHDQLRRRTPTGSSATASRRCSSTPASSTTATAPTRSRCSRCSSGCPVTAWLLWLVRRSGRDWEARRRLRGLDLRAALHRPRLPDLVPRLAVRRDRGRVPARSGRGAARLEREHPGRARRGRPAPRSATIGEYCPSGSVQTSLPVRASSAYVPFGPAFA